MNALFRFVLMLLCFVATFYFVFWMGGALILSLLPPAAMQPVALVIAMAAAIGVAVFVWKQSRESHRGLVTFVLKGAFIICAVGFVAGFFGPMIFAPDSNQGPLLGLFITGPLGFVLGAIGGGIYWGICGRRATKQGNSDDSAVVVD